MFGSDECLKGRFTTSPSLKLSAGKWKLGCDALNIEKLHLLM